MSATTECAREGCTRPVQARGFCNTHYSRWRKTGTTEPPARPSLAERLWAQVEVMPSGCWEFTGYTNAARGGYGAIRPTGQRVSIGAHVAAWTVTNGPVPDGLIVRHQCDNPPCCNPEHLELGTHADNTADKVSRGRAAVGEGNGASKLTAADVTEIRQAAAAGTAQTDLASRWSVSTALVSLIVNRRIWKEVA